MEHLKLKGTFKKIKKKGNYAYYIQVEDEFENNVLNTYGVFKFIWLSICLGEYSWKERSFIS